ncbi:MAG: DUF192 domain-containing protein [Phycisphaerales bacterium]|nr:DUF192 domain-containing protein [Phycisphaerales bacterium]
MKLLLFVLLALGGCQKPGDLASTTMPIGNQSFTLEIADQPRQRETGLMHRPSMPADHGMIFVFPDDQPRSFWMKNTHIPLDILFIAFDGTIVQIDQMQPVTGTAQTYRLARYVIELNLGAVEKTGVKPGDKLEIPPAVKALRPGE